MSGPLVSVYIPTYNRCSLLARALSSVRTQDYRNIEIIVVDDGSIDGTIDYMDMICREDSRVKFIKKNFNSGACESRNLAIETARGEYLTGLDDDDYFMPGRISNFVSTWCDDFVASYTDSVLVRKGGINRVIRRWPAVVADDLLIANRVGNQIFTRTSLLRSMGGFSTEFPAWQDLEFWYRILSGVEGKMVKVFGASYVIDQSHDHERITTGRIDKIYCAYDLFVKKYSLNRVDTLSLRSQIFPYDISRLTISNIIVFLLSGARFRVVAKISKMYVLKYFVKISA